MQEFHARISSDIILFVYMLMSNESNSFHCINVSMIVSASEGLGVEIWVQNSDPFIMLSLLFLF